MGSSTQYRARIRLLPQREVDPATEIPPQGLLPNRPARAQPYLYSEDEIRRLLTTAKNLSSSICSLRPRTHYCLLGLLVVTGMRLGEAMNLQLQDVDWSEGLLTIRNSRNLRQVPPDSASIPRPRRSWLSMPSIEIGSLPGDPFNTSSFQVAGIVWTRGTFTEPSMFCPGRSDYALLPPAAGRGCTIFGYQVSRFRPYVLVSLRRRARAAIARLVHLSRPFTRHRYLLVPHQHARVDDGRRETVGEAVEGSDMTNACFPVLLESFFTERLIAQKRVSPHTIASYRDTFRLLLQFSQKHLRKAPSQLTLADLNAPLLSKFLDDLEAGRANGARSRNLRLTAIRSFFRYAALEAPDHSGLIQRVLAIPQ